MYVSNTNLPSINIPEANVSISDLPRPENKLGTINIMPHLNCLEKMLPTPRTRVTDPPEMPPII